MKFNSKHAFVFGDVHGCKDQLERILIEARRIDSNIDIFSTGDLIDRGPHSKEVIDLCIDYCVQPVMGNHEALLIEYLKGDMGAYYMHISKGMGGDPTVRSYLNLDNKAWDIYAQKNRYIQAIPKLHKDFFLSLPKTIYLVIDEKEYLISHAGLNYTQDKLLYLYEQISYKNLNITSLEENIDAFTDFYSEDHLWEFKKSNQIPFVGKAIQITGHLPYQEPQLTKSSYQIDTGCGKGGKLTGILLPENTIIQG